MTVAAVFLADAGATSARRYRSRASAAGDLTAVRTQARLFLFQS